MAIYQTIFATFHKERKKEEMSLMVAQNEKLSLGSKIHSDIFWYY